MVSKNNLKNKMEQTAARTPHYGIRKLSVGVASVLISTTLYMGATTAKADTLPSTATDAATTKPETASSSSSTQDNTTVDKTAKTTVPATASFTDTSVSTTPNAQASTTNTIAGATSSDKSGANNNSLVANNVESTTNTTAQTQPKPNVVTSNKVNVDNQVGSNVENKVTTTADTNSVPTAPKRVVRSLAAAPTTDSNELVENQDYTVSNVSLEDHKKQDNFDEDATFLHADINLKDGNAIANKQITFTFNSKEFNGFDNLKNQDLNYNGQVIGKLTGFSNYNRVFKIAFNDNTRGFKDIDLSLKIYLSSRPYTMETLYTSNQAKNNEKYTVRHNYQIGSTNYYVDREVTLHYLAEKAPVMGTSKKQWNGPISYWYGPQAWYKFSVNYYTAKDGKTYVTLTNIPGKSYYGLSLGEGFITPDTKSVTINFESGSKWYSQERNKLELNDGTINDADIQSWTKYNPSTLVSGTTDIYTAEPFAQTKVTDKQTYTAKDLMTLDGNTLTATDLKAASGINNLSSRMNYWPLYGNGYVGQTVVDYAVVPSDNLKKFVIDNADKIIETKGEFLKNNTDFTNVGKIVAHNNTTGQDVYYDLHNSVVVNNRDVTTPPDGAILVSAGKDIPTKIYTYNSSDVPSNVDKSKLTKEVTRTINVHNPNGTVNTTTQTVAYHQTVTVAGDEVVYNNDWTATHDSWDEFNVPQVENYKASQDKVNSSQVNVDTQNQTVDITYTANEEKETTTFTHTFHWLDKLTGETIAPDTVITIDYERTNVPAENKYGDWSVVPDSLRQTGTKVDVTYNKTATNTEQNTDIYTLYVHYPSIPNKGNVSYYSIYGQASVSDIIYRAAHKQGPTSTTDHSVRYNHVMNTTVKFVDDDNNGENVGHKDIRGEVGEKSTVDLPENYELADGQSNTVTFAADTPAEMTVHLKHKVETKQIKVDAKLNLIRLIKYGYNVSRGNNGNYILWLNKDEAQNHYNKKFIDVGSVTGSVQYDLVSGKIVKVNDQTFKFDKTLLNYPSDDDVANGGSLTGSDDLLNHTFTQWFNEYVTRNNSLSYKVYASANATKDVLANKDNVFDGAFNNNNLIQFTFKNGKQYGSDSEIDTSTIDNSFSIKLNDLLNAPQREHSQKIDKNSDGSLNTTAYLDMPIVYQPYISKTVTRTINITSPDKTVKTIKQTANINQNVGAYNGGYGSFWKGDAYVTDNNWSTYEVPTVAGYTASQKQVDAVAVNKDTTDQTVNISYTADEVKEKTTFKHTFHYIDKLTGEKIIPDTVITVTYERTNVPGENKYGDWTIVPDSVTQTGTKVNATFTKTGSNTTVSGQNVDVYKLQFDYPPMPKNGNVTYSSIYGSTGISDIIYRDANKQAPNLDNEFEVKYNHVMNTAINYVDDDFKGETVDYRGGIQGEVGEKYKLTYVPENYELANGQADTITFTADTPDQITVHLKHKVVTKQLKLNVDLDLMRLIKYNYNNINENGGYLPWVNDDEFNTLKDYYNGTPVRVGSVTGSVQYDLAFHIIVKANNGETLKFDNVSLNYPSDNDVANVGSLLGFQDYDKHTFVSELNKDTHENLSYKVYASANLTKDLLTNKKLFGPNMNSLVPFTFENGKQYGSDYEINTSTINNSFSINFNDLVKNDFGVDDTSDDGSLSGTAILHMPIAYQPYISKTVTRTINVTNPDGTVKTIKQTAEINQNVGLDEDSHYNNYLHKGDAYVTDNNWKAYEVPNIPGYTANKSQVDAVVVNGSTTDQTVDISYTANKQQVNVNYVDINDGNKVVHTTTVNGVTDGDATVPNELPAGYKLVDGQSVPKTIHFNANNDNVNVKVQHATVTVTPDQPKTPSDKLPDNPGKSYPSGVAKDDLSKTVTRKIVITTPDGKETITNQTVTFTRNATVDEVTNGVTYGSWSENGKHEFVTVNVPTVPGYTANGDVPSLTVTPDSKDTTVEIGYTADEQSTNIVFVDKDGKTVDKVTVNGKTGDTVETNAKVPDGWKLTGNETVPSTVTFTGEGVPDKKVTVDHATVTVTPDSPKTPSDKLPDNPGKSYPSGVAKDDLVKTVTRKVVITAPDGKETVTNQTVTFTRNATVDEVTGNVTYGSWSEDGKHEFATVNVPTVPGYTANGDVPSLTVTPDSKDTTVEIGYTANEQSTNIVFVDKDGKTVDKVTVNGKTGETVDTNAKVPNGWKLTGNEVVPSTVTFTGEGVPDKKVTVDHATVTVTSDSPKTPSDKLPDNPGKSYPSGVAKDNLSKTVTRKVVITTPDDKETVTNQTVTFTRNATVDEVTGNVTYGSWSENGKHTFATVNVPTVPGYTANGDVPSLTVTPDSKDTTVEIGYTANEQQININYVDISNGNKVVHTTTAKGVTDGDTNVVNELPAGYKLVDGQSVPKTVHFNVDNDDINIKVDHATVTVTSDSPKTPSDKLPDNPGKSYPSGVAKDDLVKIVTRKVVITTPDIKETVTNQTVTFTRNATVDEVTGNVTYGSWSENGKHTFVTVNVPTVPGYTANGDVPSLTVTPDSKNTTVEIGYTANEQSTNIVFVDKDGKTVDKVTVNGKTGDTVETNAKVPDGWKLTDNEIVPSTVTFTGEGVPDKKVTVDHATVTVTSDSPKTPSDKLPDNPGKSYPSGVAENDLNKDVTRTIKVTDPTGKATTETQTVHLTRTATVDEVTGNITYGDWTTGSFDSYNVPVIEGYTATQSKVDTATVTSDTQNSEVNITYTANPQSIKINYVDDDKGGTTVKSDALNGKTDQTVKAGIAIPENYTVVGTAPSDYTFKAKDNVDITVHLKHVIDTKSEEKTITRTIKVTNPNGGVMTIPQSAKSTRTVSTDKVTGKVTYGDWSKATLDGYDVPLIEGYTASQPNVDQTTVDGNIPDSEVNITYTANKQVISIDYVDNGKVISTQVLTGKTDETVETNIQSPDKDKYVVVGTNPDTYTFKAKDNEDVRVEVKHVINDSTESKDVTRTIVVTSPDGKETTKVQKATVSRTVHTDAVTGAKTYDEWSKATLDKYNVPTVDGYTPSLNVVEGLEVDGKNEDSVVKVGYTANEQTAKIVYVDGDNGNSTVKTDILSGKTDQTVETGVKVPDGYTVEGSVPDSYTFKAKDNADITVKLKHGTTTVTPDKPKTTNDKLPNNPTKSYPSGVAENDLNKDVTRTIKVTDPKGKVTTKTQTVHLTRTATVDEVTDKVTYGDWSTGAFDNYDVPVIEGYTPNVATISAQTVTDETKPTTITVNYAPNEHTTQLQYVDDKGAVIKTVPLHGVTGETVTVPKNLPAGWILTPTTKLPETITMTANGHPAVIVTVQHGKVTVIPDKPKTTADPLPDNPYNHYPTGVGETDLNKTLTRTINFTVPGQKTRTITQTVTVHRSATVDEVTGEVTYSDWSTAKWPEVTVPNVLGYTPNTETIPAQTVTDKIKNTTVTVNYTADEHTTQLQYVNEHGNVVETLTLQGRTGETVTVPTSLPAGWVLTPNTKVPATITMTANGHPKVVATVQHGKVTVTPDKPKTTADPLPDNPNSHYPTGVGENDLNKTLTRTINLTVPGQKARTITQTVTVHRSATVDEVTGEVTYSSWSTAEWPEVTVPSVQGYTPNQEKVPAEVAQADHGDQTVTIAYHKDSVPNKTEKQTSTVKTKTVEPTKPTTTTATTDEKHQSETKSMPTKTTNPASATLPQTGDDKNTATWLGVINMLFTGLVGWWTKKKHKPQV